ncbi:MAG: LPS-assembly protein LptD [Candidatus Glassbacteria bacterium]|nr:LPS-assembly protein LptD [Candidatus Glassbacteria bacterium]
MNLPRYLKLVFPAALLCLVPGLCLPAAGLARQSADSTAASAADSAGPQEPSLKIPEPDSVMNSLLAGHAPAGGSVEYSGEHFIFLPGRSVVLIRGQASVKSGGQVVTADTMIAFNRATGDVFVNGAPELTEGGEKIGGSRMRYNMKRDRGVVDQGRTVFGEWDLESEQLSKVGKDSIFGLDNSFSSCDKEDGRHYHFESPRIKVIRNKRVFAAPVILKVGKVPVFALPFVFFPITRGNRVSGFLQPRIGINSVMRDRTTGRTIGNLGYFWAPGDHLDFLGAVDLRTSSQTTLRGRTRYSKRYAYDGNFDLRLVKDKVNSSTAYSVFGRHNQAIAERGRLIADVNYTSTRSLLRNTSFDRQDLLRQSLRSTASFSWRPSWGSFTSSVRHEMFLQDDQSRTRVNLPSLSFSLNRRNLFEGRSKTVPRRAGLITPGWLYNLTYGFSTDYSNTRTSSRDNPTEAVHRSNTRFDLASPQTLYGWLKFNPALRYSTELVHDNQAAGDKLSHEQTVNLSTSVSTQVFGIFDGPRLGPVFRWRHTVRPRLTYTFQPDLSENKQGGRTSKLDFTVSNDIDYKYYESAGGRAAEDSTAPAQPREKNGKLLSLRNSVAYDFIRAARSDTLGWGDLSTTLTSTPTSFINLQVSLNHQLVQPGPREIFKPFMNRLSTTATLRGTYQGKDRRPDTGELEEEAYLESLRYPGTLGSAFDTPMRGYDTQRDLAFSRAMPWTVNLSHNLNRRRDADKASQSLRWSFTFNPTPNWHLVYSSSYNFSDRGLQGQTFILNRDLHCWQANLSLITLPGGRFEFTFSTYLRANPAIRVPDVRRASN